MFCWTVDFKLECVSHEVQRIVTNITNESSLGAHPDLNVNV